MNVANYLCLVVCMSGGNRSRDTCRAKVALGARASNDELSPARLRTSHGEGSPAAESPFLLAHLTNTLSSQPPTSGLQRLGIIERLFRSFLPSAHFERGIQTRRAKTFKGDQTSVLHISPRVLFIGTLLRRFNTFSSRRQ